MQKPHTQPYITQADKWSGLLNFHIMKSEVNIAFTEHIINQNRLPLLKMKIRRLEQLRTRLSNTVQIKAAQSVINVYQWLTSRCNTKQMQNDTK